MKGLVLAFSGGMDSSVLLHMAYDRGYEEIHTISFNYGQRHSKELECVDYQLESIRAKANTDGRVNTILSNYVIDASFLKQIASTSSLTNNDIDNPDISKIAGDAQPVSYVPFRNLLFNTISCSYAEGIGMDTVWYGAAQVDSLAGYWDGSQQFVDCFNNITALNREHRINLEAPLLTMSKEEIITEGVRLGVNFGKTWTCYSNREDELADATTPSSSMRVQGFLKAGYKDPIKYIQQDKINALYNQYNCKEL